MNTLQCQSCEVLTTVTWSGRCQSCYRSEFNAPVPIDHLVERHSEAASVTTIARQARTIRRLRALADGYREQRDVARAETPDYAAHEERARIVALLRSQAENLCIVANCSPALRSIADAIERGEL